MKITLFKWRVVFVVLVRILFPEPLLGRDVLATARRSEACRKRGVSICVVDSNCRSHWIVDSRGVEMLYCVLLFAERAISIFGRRRVDSRDGC